MIAIAGRPAGCSQRADALDAGTVFEAVAGAAVPIALGEQFSPIHGLVEPPGDEGHVRSEIAYRVVSRLKPTGTPWDIAILVPIDAGRMAVAEAVDLSDALDPAVVARVLAEKEANYVSPIGFGDSWRGHPVVGVFPEFIGRAGTRRLGSARATATR